MPCTRPKPKGQRFSMLADTPYCSLTPSVCCSIQREDSMLFTKSGPPPILIHMRRDSSSLSSASQEGREAALSLSFLCCFLFCCASPTRLQSMTLSCKGVFLSLSGLSPRLWDVPGTKVGCSLTERPHRKQGYFLITDFWEPAAHTTT